jgi:biotin transport system substrate-specific component
LIIYALGVTWLAFWLPGGPLVSMKLAFIEGMLPFLIGDTLKLIVAALLLPTAWVLLRLGKHAR